MSTFRTMARGATAAHTYHR